MSQNIYPKWWQLYLTLPLLVALFLLEHRLKLSERGHQAVQIGILLAVFGLVHLWLSANSRSLSAAERRQYYGSVVVTRIPPRQMTEAAQRPMLQLPEAELKGPLGNTFEMDFIDADFTPVEETTQDSKKD